MSQFLNVRGIHIGEGMPKICVSLMGETMRALVEKAEELMDLPLDVIEWRLDYYTEILDLPSLIECTKKVRETIGDIPLLITFRSKEEGGVQAITEEIYTQINKELIDTGLVDIIDVELSKSTEVVEELIRLAHEKEVKVILSKHDFNKTPMKREIIETLCKMKTLGGDIAKVAVMPRTREDVLILLDATNEMKSMAPNLPIITMSMGELGTISRCLGEVFGSCLTFAAGKECSAPGQIGAQKLYAVLETIHEL